MSDGAPAAAAGADDGGCSADRPAAPTAKRSSAAPLHLLFWAQLVSVLGDACFQGGLPLVVKAMADIAVDRQGRALGLVFAIGTLPFLLFAVPLGALVDRLDRRRVMIAADLGRAAVGVALGWALWRSPEQVGLGTLAVAAFAISTGSALFNPARDALIPELVEPKRLFQANALVQTAHQLGPILGWVAALAVVGALGRAHLFTVDGASFLVSAALLLAIRPSGWRAGGPRQPATAGAPAGAGAAPQAVPLSFVADLREGLGHVFRDRPVRALLALTFCNNLFIMGPALVAAAALINVEWGLSDRHYLGFEMLFACGMLAGTALGLGLRRRFRRSRILLGALVWDGLTYVAFYWIEGYAVALAVIFVHAAAVPLIVVSRAALLQEVVPARFHGRTFALVGLTVTGAMALSLALTGLGVDRFGAHAMFLVGGLGGTLTGLVGWTIRGVRDLG